MIDTNCRVHTSLNMWGSDIKTAWFLYIFACLHLMHVAGISLLPRPQRSRLCAFVRVDVCGRKLGSLLFYSFYRQPPERSRDYSPKQCGWMFQNVCVVLMCVCAAYVCASAFSFHIFIQYHWGLHKEFQSPDEKGGRRRGGGSRGCRAVGL